MKQTSSFSCLIPFVLTCQVMYDQTSGGTLLRKYTGISLAWWHNYKWAVHRVMDVFGKDFIGPFFHHLFPDVNYSTEKMTHTARTIYLQYILLAYPSFKDRLNVALLRTDLTSPIVSLLTNLSDLCEYFLPVVQHTRTTHTS